MLNKFSKVDKIFFIYLMTLFIALAYTFSLNSLVADEGTHLLLSLFYKDLITHVISTGDFSLESAYDYSINYLIHYPKLQIAYPPLYHLTNALFFQLLGPSELVGRFVNLMYAILAFAIFYFFVKEYFGEKTALIATVLFSFSPFSLFYSSRAWLDYTFFFWFITSLYFFSKAIRTNKISYFALCGIAAALSFLGKQIGGFLLIFYIIAMVLQKESRSIKVRNILLLLVTFSLLAVPYILILNVVGGLEINVVVTTFYAETEPTSFVNPMFWLYYLVNTGFFAPFFPLLVLGLVYYVYKKQPYSREMLLFFLVFYICISAVPTKEFRFSEAFMLPAYAASGAILMSLKRKILLPVFVAVYCMVSAALFLPTIGYYPVQETVETMTADIPAESSIALLSDEDPAFSSVFMWYVAVEDRNITHKVYRPCAFHGMSVEEVRDAFKENGVYYVAYSNWSIHRSLDLIKDDLTYLFSKSKGDKKTDVYKYNDFSPSTNQCNYICLTQEWVCVE